MSEHAPKRIERRIVTASATASVLQMEQDQPFWMIVVHPLDAGSIEVNHFGTPTLSGKMAPKSIFHDQAKAQEVADDMARRLGKRFVVLGCESLHMVAKKPVERIQFSRQAVIEGPADDVLEGNRG